MKRLFERMLRNHFWLFGGSSSSAALLVGFWPKPNQANLKCICSALSSRRLLFARKVSRCCAGSG
jgi:hypothetical protein